MIEEELPDELENDLDDIEPVSYTHLDVYKRQVFQFSFGYNFVSFSPLEQFLQIRESFIL